MKQMDGVTQNINYVTAFSCRKIEIKTICLSSRRFKWTKIYCQLKMKRKQDFQVLES